MTVTGLEISLNGKVLYTVGMEGWQHLTAHIHGVRITKEMHEQMIAQMGEVPEGFEARDMKKLLLQASVGLPNLDGPHSSTRGYGQEELSIGDVVTIRVIETDSPDLPEPPPPDGEGLFYKVRTPVGDDKE